MLVKQLFTLSVLIKLFARHKNADPCCHLGADIINLLMAAEFFATFSHFCTFVIFASQAGADPSGDPSKTAFTVGSYPC
jgi:hypothetical protein